MEEKAFETEMPTLVFDDTPTDAATAAAPEEKATEPVLFPITEKQYGLFSIYLSSLFFFFFNNPILIIISQINPLDNHQI